MIRILSPGFKTSPLFVEISQRGDIYPDTGGIDKRITCHTLHHSFATTMLEKGINIRMLQELMGHADIKTTEMYTHVMEKDISRLTSPLDDLV